MGVVWDLLIGAAGSVVSYFAIKLIERSLAKQTVRGRRRQIDQLTQEIQLLERLGVSDRSLLLFAFQFLFPIITLAAIGR